MSIFQSRITEYLDNGHLLNEEFLHVILQVIYNLKPCKVFQLGNQPCDPIIDISDFNLTILNVEMTQLNVLPLFNARVVLGY